ncbi:PepSY domain-containing protein, partial [Candidatus Woesearchaeota archaeon]|nr:PepSY domain-containing protein [Candidatus Woesearchaeota archaeon]
KQIAIRQLGGIPTDIDKETRDGVEVYVVEVDPPSRDKINVIIEIATGDILGFE